MLARSRPTLALVLFTLTGCSSDSTTQRAAPDTSDASTGGRGTGGAFHSGGKGGASTGGKASTGGSPGAGGTVGAGGIGTVGSNDRDASIHDDASVRPVDASSDAKSGVDTGASETGAPAPLARFGQARFVNTSPDSEPLDFCMKLSSASTYTAPPVLRAAGITTGVPYGSQSEYVDLGVTAGTPYDFYVVGSAAASCAPPILGAFGNLTFDGSSSATISIFQNAFPSSGNYSGATFTDHWGQTRAVANARVYYSGNGLSPSVDIHASHTGVSDETWFSDFKGGYGTAFHATTAAQYAFSAEKTGTSTVLAQKSGVTLASGNPVDLFLFATGASTAAFIGCPSSPLSGAKPCGL